jgi:hypothetical protein
MSRYFWRCLDKRQCVSAVLLVVYGITTAGIPLPSSSRPVKSGEMFPCAASGCGCNSAEVCWRSCCCHTLSERTAWARKHDVRPPDFAIAQAKAARLNLSWLAKRGESDSADSVAACCASRQGCTTRTCCDKQVDTAQHQSARSCSSHRHQNPDATKTAQHVVAWRAMKCHGHSSNWLAAVPTLIVVRIELSHILPRVAWLGPAPSEAADSLSGDPAVPPPKRA